MLSTTPPVRHTLGIDRTGNKVKLDPETLLRHAVVLGSSGSGKTVTCKAIVENFAADGLPVIAIDPQGDIASLALPCDEGPESQRYRERVEVVVWTPGSTIGQPMCVNPIVNLQDLMTLKHEDRVRSLGMLSANMAALLGYNGNADGTAARTVLHMIFEEMCDIAMNLEGIHHIADEIMYLEQVAKRALRVMSRRKYDDMARRIRMLGEGTNQLLFNLGEPLSVEELLTGDDGRTRISVIYLNALPSQTEKSFFVGQLAQSIYDWMLQNPSDKPQALFYMDEVSPYIPPVKKPACKEALVLLFKQARKYGVCCLLATQNPADIDYKVMAQFSTWLLGRMMLAQDIKKVEKSIKAVVGDAAGILTDKLPSLNPGGFLWLSPDQGSATQIAVRQLWTEHRTLEASEIEALHEQKGTGFTARHQLRVQKANLERRAKASISAAFEAHAALCRFHKENGGDPEALRDSVFMMGQLEMLSER